MISSYNNNNQSQGADSKDRLEDISHHFFGKSSKDSAAKSVSFLPVLLESEEQDSYVFGLNKFLNLDNHTCTVVNVDNALRESLPVDKKSDIELTSEVVTNRLRIAKYLQGQEKLPDLCLLPFVSHKISLLKDGDFLLVIVPASLAGVRRIIYNLEKLCAGMKDVVVGVVIIEASSLQMSQLCYDVISNSLNSFFGLRSMLLGHLLSESAIDLTKGRLIQFPDNVDHLDSAPIELDDIAVNVWDRLHDLKQQKRSMNALLDQSQTLESLTA